MKIKKQGVLPLTFVTSDDYELVQAEDVIDITGLTELAPGSRIIAILHHKDGSNSEIELNHSLNNEQIKWFKAGSALNSLRG